MADTQSSGAEFKGPLFITGMWRSGASLLYALLNKHSRIGLMYEADMILMRQAFLLPGDSNWAERWEAWNRAVSRHGLEPAILQQKTDNFRSAFEFVHKEFARRKGADIWGDKSPDLYDQLVPLAKNFPGARFIVVWRHPMATISSMQVAAGKGARFFQKRGMPLRGLLGNVELRQQCDRLMQMGAPVCEINYEDLVENTIATIEKICAFLNLPMDVGLATLSGANRESTHPGEHHALLRGDKILALARAQVLSDGMQQKIQRYIAFWGDRCPAKWAENSDLPKKPVKSAGFSERFRDRLVYRAYRWLDNSKRLVFCLAPLKIVTQHRKQKGHG